MYIILKTERFNSWLRGLKDLRAKAKILVLLRKAESGNLGDYKFIKSGIYEFRVHVGKGYRIYFAFKESKIILLMSGGIKSTQKSDVEKALKIKKQSESQNGNKYKQI